MSREDALRAMREAQYEAKAKRALGAIEPKPKSVTENPLSVTENATKVPATKVSASKMGRPMIGNRPMTSTERSQRRRVAERAKSKEQN